MISTKKSKFIVFGKPDLGEEEMSAVMDVLRSGWIGTGKVAKQFENEFSAFMGGGYSVAVSSATMGLVLAMKALGVAKGDNVLTSPLTFCATVNAILQAGANPLFSEVTAEGLLDASKIRERHLQGIHWQKVDYLLPVNYLGKSAALKSEWDVPVIEDAAHSFGGSCGYGQASVFSFYATKNITCGEGGMVWTKDRDVAEKVRLFSNHGQSSGAWSRYNSGPIENYAVKHPGFKGNLPDLLAAIGLTQLRRWPELKEKREKVWRIYEKAFGKKGSGHSKHLYTIRVRNRAQVREKLYHAGIGTGIHYEALHLEPAYSYLGYKRGDFPLAEKIGEETLSLPLSAGMTEEEATYVVKSVKEAIRG